LSTVAQILVVEDFKPFCEFISSMLEDHNHLHVVCQVANGLEAVEKAKVLHPDLILLDIGLPGLNGIEVARQIVEWAPKQKIIFVTQESSPEVVQEALRTGAIGYVVKSRAATDLLPAIEAALQGNKFVSSSLNGQDPSARNVPGRGR
jgi:DNA-binding NarL/FixJ family response regulator